MVYSESFATLYFPFALWANKVDFDVYSFSGMLFSIYVASTFHTNKGQSHHLIYYQPMKYLNGWYIDYRKSDTVALKNYIVRTTCMLIHDLTSLFGLT